MIESSFQISSGVGPLRERKLWSAGVHRWADLPTSAFPAAGLSAALARQLRDAAAAMDAALTSHDLPALASKLPSREHWRLLGQFADEAIYLDIETDVEEGVTVIGLLTPDGPRVLLAGRDLDAFPELMRDARLLITYNGASFDVPILMRAFPGWRPPPVHVDLRPLWARLGHIGGLKRLEDAEGIGRPAHLRGISGFEIMAMWRHARRGDQRALRRLVEYNLYDAINLRTLAALGYNRMLERLAAPVVVDGAACVTPGSNWVVNAPAPSSPRNHGPARSAARMPISHRGDVLYDVSKILLAL